MSTSVIQLILFSAKLGFCLFMSLAILSILARLRTFKPSLNLSDTTRSNLGLTVNTGNRWVLGVCVLTVYFVVALASYFSWPVGDEWLLISSGSTSLKLRAIQALHYHFNWCSRFPEIVGIVGGLHRFGWQDWVISPLFVAGAPFVILRLFNCLSGQRKPMQVGLYILTSSCLLFIAPTYYTSYWVNVTYVWTSIPSLFLVSLFWDKQDKTCPLWKIAAAWLLGAYCGWGTEGLAQLLVLVLTLRLAWMYVKKTPPNILLIGAYLGVLTGAFMLLSSSALEHRQSAQISYLASMSYEEICSFVQNLTWEKVRLLKGGAAIANLKDIPLHLHYLFIPYSLQVYATYALIPLCALVCTALYTGMKSTRKELFIALIFLLLAIEHALSYLIGAIPNVTSFIPSGILTVCSVSYLYYKLEKAVVFKFILTFVACSLVFAIYVPDIQTAMAFKKYDYELEERIAEQCARGHSHISLRKLPIPETCSTVSQVFTNLTKRHTPFSSMLIEPQFKTDPKAWENEQATKYFEKKYSIQSIERQE